MQYVCDASVQPVGPTLGPGRNSFQHRNLVGRSLPECLEELLGNDVARFSRAMEFCQSGGSGIHLPAPQGDMKEPAQHSNGAVQLQRATGNLKLNVVASFGAACLGRNQHCERFNRTGCVGHNLRY